MGLWVFCSGLSSLASYSLEKKQSGTHECKKIWEQCKFIKCRSDSEVDLQEGICAAIQ